MYGFFAMGGWSPMSMDIFMRGVVPICLSSSANAYHYFLSVISLSQVWFACEWVHLATKASCSGQNLVVDLLHLC